MPTSTIIRSAKSYFSRLQIRNKKWFTSIYFLQILTKPCKTPLVRKQLSLNASWFSYGRTQKNRIFLEKLIWKKIQKNFIVNNNNKIFCPWYLFSKLPVSRFIVNQTNRATSRTKTNIFKYCAFFAIKWLKYTCNKGIIAIQIIDKSIFVLFRNFFPFNWKAKLVSYYFLLSSLTKQLRYATYGSWNLLFILRLY